LAIVGYGVWALVGQLAVNAAFSSLGFWWAHRRLGQRPSIRFSFNRELAIWLLKFGATMAIGAIATIILLQFDNFLVLTFVGSAAAGYYVQAYKVAQWPTGLVTHIIARASLPTYAKLQNDPVRLSKAFELSLWAILTLAMPLALAIFAAAPDFLLLLYGPKWLPSAVLLRFLIGYSVLRPLLDDTGALYTALGQPRRVTLVLGVQALTLIAVATPLTLQFDAVGTAIGVGVAFVAGIGLTYYLVSRTLTVPLTRLFLPPMIASVASLILYWSLTQMVDLNVLPLFGRVVLKGGFVALTFMAIVVLIERRTLLERVNYLWRLVRRQPA
jgi:PST family polysaccharide transporter